MSRFTETQDVVAGYALVWGFGYFRPGCLALDAGAGATVQAWVNATWEAAAPSELELAVMVGGERLAVTGVSPLSVVLEGPIEDVRIRVGPPVEATGALPDQAVQVSVEAGYTGGPLGVVPESC